MSDTRQRFLFADADIRGELCRLSDSYQQALATHHYPPRVADLLGEFLAASVLLSATLKFEGIISLQARSEGEIPLIMAEISSEGELRGIAHQAQEVVGTEFQQLLAKGQLAITITPRQGQRYQGIVPLEGENLAQCLENYFAQSEQLATRIWLQGDGCTVSGLLLQQLPASQHTDPELRSNQWEHIVTLTDTLSADELGQLPFQAIMHRLYHQEQIHIYQPDKLIFKCSCSETRTLEALRALGEKELRTLLAEKSPIEIHCEFCNQRYTFDEGPILSLFQKTHH